MRHILNLALLDFKIIFRTPLLKSFLLLPIILFVLIIWFLPSLLETYPNLKPYLNIFMIVGVIENTQMFCFINGMVLLEERESGISMAYGTLPLKTFDFVASRFILPYLITVGLNITLLMVQPLVSIQMTDALLIATLSGMVVPIYAMTIASLAKNRMQGMVYVKVLNLLVLVPIIAFFIPDTFRNIFAIVPTHWLFSAIDNMVDGKSILFSSSIGFAHFGILTLWVSLVFKRRYVQ